MSGWLTPGFGQLPTFTGVEQMSLDTQISYGSPPQTAMTSSLALAVALDYLSRASNRTTVAGTRYYVGISIGYNALLTGVQLLMGGTGGTDNLIVELHDSTGALVATSTTSGTTAGTANTWQRIAFTAQYQAAPGTYYIAVQSNGTTATPAVFSSPGLQIVVGSATGTFGTGAAITPPTTYSTGVGPVAMVY